MPHEPNKETKPKLILPKKANFKAEVKRPTIGEKYDSLCNSLPEFRFYGEAEPQIPDGAEERIQRYLTTIERMRLFFEEQVKANDFVEVATVLEYLVQQNYWKLWPYDKLLSIYNYAGLKKDCDELFDYTLGFFSKRRERMRQNLVRLGRKYGEEELVDGIINNKEKVSYYNGLFVVYDPYPWIEECIQ